MARKIQQHIEIVRSSVSGLNSLSKKSSDAIYALLASHYAKVGVSIIDNVSDLAPLVAKRPDLVFMGMKYVPDAAGKKIWISEYLAQHGIKHTGSPKSAIALEQNKPLAKKRILASGIKTSPYMVVKRGAVFDSTSPSLRFPLFVKPASLGAGKGVDEHSVVNDLGELQAKLASLAADHDADALIEEFLPGREYSVAVLKEEHSQKLIAMPLELVAPPNAHGLRILSYERKSAVSETPVFPVTDKQTRTRLNNLALRAFTALGAQDYGRIDIRADESGMLHFLEANLIPGLIEGSGNFPKACVMNTGMSHEAMILHIVRLGLAHHTEPLGYGIDASPAPGATTTAALA